MMLHSMHVAKQKIDITPLVFLLHTKFHILIHNFGLQTANAFKSMIHKITLQNGLSLTIANQSAK